MSVDHVGALRALVPHFDAKAAVARQSAQRASVRTATLAQV